MEYILETRGLKKSYGHFHALNGLDMHLPKGAIYGFVGRNGAGKTTLIRLLCGLQQPTAGEYLLYGVPHSSSRIAQVRRRMGAVVETPSIYMNMTAEENLRQQYRILGLPSYSGIQDLLELVGLQDTGRKKAGVFSLGMRQRLGIAVAMAGNPDLLVLDEPANGLDPQGIVEIRELILKLNRERRVTVLISSHILDELSRIATHYGFIDRGAIVKEISTTELEAACRKCTHLEVSNIRALARVLERLQLAYTILSDTAADIYAAVPVTRLAAELAQEGYDIHTITQRDESLESYYMALIGGNAV